MMSASANVSASASASASASGSGGSVITTSVRLSQEAAQREYGSYLQVNGKNCYTGYGGRSIDSDPVPDVTTAAQYAISLERCWACDACARRPEAASKQTKPLPGISCSAL